MLAFQKGFFLPTLQLFCTTFPNIFQDLLCRTICLIFGIPPKVSVTLWMGKTKTNGGSLEFCSDITNMLEFNWD